MTYRVTILGLVVVLTMAVGHRAFGAKISGDTPTILGAGHLDPSIAPFINSGRTSATYDIVSDSVGVIDMVYRVANSATLPEPRITATVTNSTGVLWSGYRLQLGFGTASTFTPVALTSLVFTSGTSGGGWPRFSALSPNSFSTTDIQWTTFNSSGGGPGSLGNAFTYTFKFTVPDANFAQIPDASETADGYYVTLRQTPIPAPEPSTGAAMGIAAMGIIVLGRGTSARQSRVINVKPV